MNFRAERRATEIEIEAERQRELLLANDTRFWNQTGASGSEDGLRRYLQRYPDGEFAEVAVARLDTLENQKRTRASAGDRQLWGRVQQIDTVPAYEEYLRRARQGAFREEALARIAQLKSARANANQFSAARQAEQSLNLSPRTRQIVESRLRSLDLNPGRVDGVFDRDTRRAIRRYQAARNLEQSGFLSEQVVVRLLADSVRQIFQ